MSAETALSALAALERAFDRLQLVLELPSPLPDAAGGSADLDLYLVSAHPGRTGLSVEGETEWLGLGDSSAAFCVLHDAERADLERSASMCLTEAAALRLDAGESRFTRRALATHLWWATGYPTDADVTAIDDVQANPQLPMFGRDDGLAEGSALFLDYLDWTESNSDSGTLAAALYSLAVSRTPAGEARYHNEPDVFDVVRHTLDEDERRVAQLLSRFAVARAFVGDRDTGKHLPQLAWAGEFGRVRFDWHIKYSELPKHVVPLRPMHPTGATYIYLELDKLPKHPELAFESWWEPPAPFKWTLVRLNPKGKELARVEVSFQGAATHAQRTVVDLKNTMAVLIVGTQLGGTDAAFPFDPDFAPFEPHSYSAHLVDI